MKIEIHCPRCLTQYSVDAGLLGSRGRRVSCRSCGHDWLAIPNRPARVSEGAEALCPQCGHSFPYRPHRPGRDAPARRILVVEDQDYFVELARDALGSRFEVASVRNPDAALKELARRPPDLLVLDLMLADGSDGREVLRSRPRQDIPVLVFTSKDEQEMYGPQWKELQALGANDLLIKGINVADDLQRKVEDLLS